MIPVWSPEAMRDALRAMQQQLREDALTLKALGAQIKAGFDGLDRGDFVEMDDIDLEGSRRANDPIGRTRQLTHTRSFRLWQAVNCSSLASASA
jgi:hypothetical protein